MAQPNIADLNDEKPLEGVGPRAQDSPCGDKICWNRGAAHNNTESVPTQKPGQKPGVRRTIA